MITMNDANCSHLSKSLELIDSPRLVIYSGGNGILHGGSIFKYSFNSVIEVGIMMCIFAIHSARISIDGSTIEGAIKCLITEHRL